MTSQCRRLEGKFALVTGASRGIGRAIAERFAAEGATVGVNYAGSEESAKETLQSVERFSAENGFGRPAHCMVHADVAKAAEVRSMVDQVISQWGRLDILVNNAGIQSEAPSDSYSLEEYERILGVNLTGALLCAQAAIRHFLGRAGGGVVLNCSSVHQLIPKPGYLAYSISKGGMGNLTRTLALEYADRGIRVNGVGPGATRTDINSRWVDDPKARKAVESHIPMGRSARSEEIASVFAFLASDDASYITGQTIYACGGLTLFNDFRVNWSS